MVLLFHSSHIHIYVSADSQADFIVRDSLLGLMGAKLQNATSAFFNWN